MATKPTPSDDAQAKRLEKAANFKRLAEARVSKTLSAMKGVAALSNKSAYVYDTAQVQKILNALQAAVVTVKNAYEKPDAVSGDGFTL